MTLHQETRIVWLFDPTPLPYVREIELFTARRVGRPRWHFDGIMVGYAELTADARLSNGYGTRRVFWLKPYDRALAPDDVYRTGAPVEGVDPATIRVRIAGRITPRAWNTRLSGPIILEPLPAPVRVPRTIPTCAHCGQPTRRLAKVAGRRWCRRGPCWRAAMAWAEFTYTADERMQHARAGRTVVATGQGEAMVMEMEVRC